MPFKSKAQRRWMYANEPEIAKRWEKHTPKGKKIPEKVKEKTAAMTPQQKAYINGFVKKAATHGLSSKQALILLKEAEPQSYKRFMDSYKAQTPEQQLNMRTNPNINPVAHQNALNAMNWHQQGLGAKTKALFTPNHPQNILNRASRGATSGLRTLMGDNPQNVINNYAKITEPVPNRAMLQEIR